MEKLWRKKQLTVYHDMYFASKQKLQNMIKAAKTNHFKGKLQECSGDQGRIFRFIAHLQNTKAKSSLPKHEDILELCTNFNNFFVSKIMDIRNEMDNSAVLIQSSPFT